MRGRFLLPVTGGLCAVALAACGGSSSASHTTSTSAFHRSPEQVVKQNAVPPAAVAELPAAENPVASDFPPADGKSLEQLGKPITTTANLGPANGGAFTPGEQRVAFGLTNQSGRYVYAPTAVYIAKSPTAPAKGPYLAPADPMTVPPQYRSEQNAGPNGIQAIYWTKLPVPGTGTFDLLALTRTKTGLIGSPGEIAVASTSPIPGVGQRPPAISTLTLPDVHGDVGLLTTRTPPEQMHSVSFQNVLGKRPIALLFSTPELCTSKVCGPVTDVMVELQHQPQFAGITFIHQEIYVDNDPAKGLRPQMNAFHQETEPWLYTINSHGVIAARLQGAFGVNEARQALEAALS
jgi:hypothetical protein